MLRLLLCGENVSAAVGAGGRRHSSRGHGDDSGNFERSAMYASLRRCAAAPFSASQFRSWLLPAFVAVLLAASSRLSFGQGFGAQPLVDLPGGNFSNQMFTSIHHAPGRPNDLFASRADGTIYRIDLTTNTESVFLTLPAAEIDAGGGYWGLLGFTFAPDFTTSGNMYVHVADDLDVGNTIPDYHHNIYVRRYSLTNHLSSSPSLSAPTNILKWAQHGTEHSGDWIGFQPGDADTLWITAGDGGNVEGAGRDMLRTGQNPGDLLASVLRVDVSGSGAGEFGNYAIPANNPQATGNPQFSTWRPEVWSIGLRSPWGGSFDRMTGDFMIGDVGSSQIGGNTGQEEVNFERADSLGGRNYGWRIMEGTTCPASQDAGVSCDPANPDPSFTMPIYDYEYGGGYGTGGATEFEGRSVTGGYVYRGPVVELQGKYIFGDWSSHQIWAVEIDRNANGGRGAVVPGSRTNLSQALSRTTGPGQSALNGPTAFGEDAAGNLYYMELDGSLYKICAGCGPEPPPLPPDVEPAATLRDDFNGNHSYKTGTVPAGGIWTAVHNADYPDTVFNSNSSNPGNLTVGLEPVGWQGNGADNGPFLHREVNAESLVEVRVRIQSQSTGNWSSAGILVRADGPLDNDTANDNYLSAHAFRPSGTNNNVQISNVAGGSESENTIPVASSQDLTHLRLVNLGNGMFEIFSSPDGTQWISRQTVTNAALASGLLEVGVWAGTYTGGVTTGSARFDWAEILLGVPAGDFNEDGEINTADYIVWRKQLGQQVTAWDGADGNGDAVVNQLDYDVWRRNFGKTIPELGSGALSPAVPEPGSLLIMLVAICSASFIAAADRSRPE